MHIVAFQVQNTRCNTLSPLSQFKKCTTLRQKVLATFFVNDDRFFSRCCRSFFNFYVLLCCVLPFTFHFFTSFSLCVSVCVVGWVAPCGCFRLYLFRNFVILCILLFFLCSSMDSKPVSGACCFFLFDCMLYIAREDAFVCAMHSIYT